VARRLQMSGELGDWLAELCSSDAVAASCVGAAVVAVMDVADVAGLAAVSELAVSDMVDPADLVAATQDAAQTVSAALGPLRERVAEAGSYRHTTRQRITPHGSYPHPFTEGEVATAAERERQLVDQMQSCQRAAESFRLKQLAATARHTSAAARRDVQVTLLAASNQTPAERAAAEPELAAAEASLASAAAELAALLPEAAALRRSFAQAAGRPNTGGSDDTAPGLFELHADPMGRDIRILFANEPADAVTLLAVLDGAEAVREHRALAIKLAGEVLAELRSDDKPRTHADADEAIAAEAAELSFADVSAFLARYFPDSETEVRRRSARVAAASTLARLRHNRQLTLADLAGHTGLTARELWHLQTEELTDADVAEVAAYVAALGGRLELTVDLGDGARLLF
jgi:hypothetical protein